MGEDFSLKTDFITPTSGSSVLCWDTMWIKNQNPDDKLNCHGEIGMVVRAADALGMFDSFKGGQKQEPMTEPMASALAREFDS